MSDTMTIGRLAKSAKVNVETIRYYQGIGLIDQPLKPTQGYRHYPISVVDRIVFIKRAQELGFSLKEIAELLSLSRQNCDQARTIAEHKCEVIQQRRNDLRAMQIELEKLITACRNNSDGNNCCAIIQTLTR